MTIVNRIKQKQNVTFLGWRDSSDLPGYVWNADVLFSPLSVTPANNRRSLLRMYDYLATDKPVVATPIESSAVHHPFVRLGSTAQDFSLLIQEAISGTARITNGIERRQYLEGHTWPRRMKLFLTHLAGVLPELAEVTNVSREFASSHCQTSDAKMVIASQPSCPRDRALD
jgi:hypothetical protein